MRPSEREAQRGKAQSAGGPESGSQRGGCSECRPGEGAAEGAGGRRVQAQTAQALRVPQRAASSNGQGRCVFLRGNVMMSPEGAVFCSSATLVLFFP